MTTGRVEQRSIPHVVSRRFEKRRTRNNACTVRRAVVKCFVFTSTILFTQVHKREKKTRTVS